MGRIIQLSKNVINQIAAGEVIERPYSVVKELVENSIDAGADKINIEVANECRDIRVADNGSGIHPDDIMLAFSKHATSKISTGEDLYNIHTMGFRGEALASIISISKLTCITRTKDFDSGIKVECQNSEVVQAKTGCAIGTVMDIRDLFYNIPARLKFLKSSKTEFAYISELVQALCLVHSDVAFELKYNGKCVVKSSGQNNLKQTMKELFSDDIENNFREVSKTDKISGLKITGYVSTPNYTRASKKDYYTYVNSRIVKCPVFQKAVDTAYKNLIGGKYPFLVLNLEMPAVDVDVNVHPSKKEVRYKNPNQIFNFIYSAVDSALNNQKQEIINDVPYIRPVTDNTETTIPVNEDIMVYESESISSIFTEKQTEKNNVTPFPKQVLLNKTVPATNIQKKILPETVKAEEDVIIGQYKKTYILIEREEGLEIVDQHIAEERYIYEQLKKNKNIDCQLLFISDVIEISKSDKELLESNKDKLAKFGYELDFLSEGEVIFRKVPQLLSKIPPKEILADILEHISGNIDNIEEQILITTSCKAAVKANTYLNLFQMQEIIRNWRTCEKPFTCPHGRPISKILNHKEIAKFFERNN